MQIPKYLELYRKDLQLKNYAQSSIDNYISQVNCFLCHFDKKFTEPQKINEESIKDWLLLANSINGRRYRISALKLFYYLTYTMHKDTRLLIFIIFLCLLACLADNI